MLINVLNSNLLLNVSFNFWLLASCVWKLNGGNPPSGSAVCSPSTITSTGGTPATVLSRNGGSLRNATASPQRFLKQSLLDEVVHGGKPRRVLSGKLPTQKPPSQDHTSSLYARKPVHRAASLFRAFSFLDLYTV